MSNSLNYASLNNGRNKPSFTSNFTGVEDGQDIFICETVNTVNVYRKDVAEYKGAYESSVAVKIKMDINFLLSLFHIYYRTEEDVATSPESVDQTGNGLDGNGNPTSSIRYNHASASRASRLRALADWFNSALRDDRWCPNSRANDSANNADQYQIPLNEDGDSLTVDFDKQLSGMQQVAASMEVLLYIAGQNIENQERDNNNGLNDATDVDGFDAVDLEKARTHMLDRDADTDKAVRPLITETQLDEILTMREGLGGAFKSVYDTQQKEQLIKRTHNFHAGDKIVFRTLFQDGDNKNDTLKVAIVWEHEAGYGHPAIYQLVHGQNKIAPLSTEDYSVESLKYGPPQTNMWPRYWFAETLAEQQANSQAVSILSGANLYLDSDAKNLYETTESLVTLLSTANADVESTNSVWTDFEAACYLPATKSVIFQYMFDALQKRGIQTIVNSTREIVFTNDSDNLTGSALWSLVKAVSTD